MVLLLLRLYGIGHMHCMERSVPASKSAKSYTIFMVGSPAIPTLSLANQIPISASGTTPVLTLSRNHLLMPFRDRNQSPLPRQQPGQHLLRLITSSNTLPRRQRLVRFSCLCAKVAVVIIKMHAYSRSMWTITTPISPLSNLQSASDMQSTIALAYNSRSNWALTMNCSPQSLILFTPLP